MTLATSAVAGGERTARWVLVGSLALNLFFVCATGALMVRHYVADSVTATPVDRSVAARMERLAATLPPADAAILRADYRANAPTVDAARDAYLKAQDEVRQTLRDELFQVDAMRAAMIRARAARQSFEQLLQDVIASASAKMSAAGRSKLADWPPVPRSTTATNR
jgi:uncharacterized membrane protein